MKKYIILMGITLLTLSAQARMMENTNATKEAAVSFGQAREHRPVNLERRRELYAKKYSTLSAEQLEKQKKRIEHTLTRADEERKATLQMELDVINAQLEKK